MKLLTATEAAKALGVSRQRICYLLAAGRLPATRFGQAWMIREEDLRAFVRLPRGRPAKSRSGKQALKEDHPSDNVTSVIASSRVDI